MRCFSSESPVRASAKMRYIYRNLFFFKRVLRLLRNILLSQHRSSLLSSVHLYAGVILKMRRIRYNFYAKISKSRGLNFANFGGPVEPHTFCTRKFLWVPSFGEHKGGKKFNVPNLHTSARSIDSNLHAHRKNRGPYGQQMQT